MLDHVSITVSDIVAAERFYDAVMAALGVSKIGARADWLGYGEHGRPEHPDRSYLSIRLGDRAGEEPGRHWCFKADDCAAVDMFWRAGIEVGGRDDGSPGVRRPYHPHYYAAFLHDPAAIASRPF